MRSTGNLAANTVCRIAETGLMITGAADAGTITIADVAPMVASNTCPGCGHPGKLRNHILRRLVDPPVVGFPSHLDVRVPRFLCTATSCSRKISQTSLVCVDDGSKPTHRITRWIL